MRFGSPFILLAVVALSSTISRGADSPPNGEASPKLDVPPAIVRRLPPDNFRPDQPAVAEVLQPIEDAIAAGGKRLRPILCYASGGIAGVDTEKMKPMACIAEWAHTASLVHDDIIDGDTERRDGPATWTVVGVKKAILLGDWLLSRLVGLAMDTNSPQSGRDMLKVIEGMVEGEFLQDRFLRQGQYTEDDWRRIAFLKTGILFQWCLKAPFFVSEREAPLVTQFEAFGRNLGMTFQKRDDFLDRDKPGEINAVFLEAGRIDNCSPTSKCFRASSIQTAARKIQQQIDLEVLGLKDQLEKIERMMAAVADREDWSAERREFSASCARLLKQVVEAQRVTLPET